MAAPTGPATMPPAGPAIIAVAATVPAFSARPGRRSSRFTRLAVPAMTPAPSATLTAERRPPRRCPDPASTRAAAARPASTDPGDLDQPAGHPAVAQGRRGGPRKPLAFCSGRPPTMSSYQPTAPAPPPAISAAAASGRLPAPAAALDGRGRGQRRTAGQAHRPAVEVGPIPVIGAGRPSQAGQRTPRRERSEPDEGEPRRGPAPAHDSVGLRQRWRWHSTPGRSARSCRRRPVRSARA